MRKILIWLGKVPGSVRKAAGVALQVTTKLLYALESDEALMLNKLIPGNVDDSVRLALIQILRALEPALKAANTSTAKKALAARVGAELTAAGDGKQHSIGQYAIWFETVYAEQKAG